MHGPVARSASQMGATTMANSFAKTRRCSLYDDIVFIRRRSRCVRCRLASRRPALGSTQLTSLISTCRTLHCRVSAYVSPRGAQSTASVTAIASLTSQWRECQPFATHSIRGMINQQSCTRNFDMFRYVYSVR